MSDSDHNNNSSDNLPEIKNNKSTIHDNVTNTENTTSKENTKHKDASEPTTFEHENAKPGTSKPAISKPGTSKPATSKPATSKPATSKPATFKPEPSKPGSSKPENFCVHPGFKQKPKTLKTQKLKGKRSSGQLPSLIIPPKINEQKPSPSPEITSRWKSIAKKATNPVLNPNYNRHTMNPSSSQHTAPAGMDNSSFPFRKNPLHRSLSKRISKQALSPQSSHNSIKFPHTAGSASLFSPNRQRQTSNFSDQSQYNNRVPKMDVSFMDVVKAAVAAKTVTPTPEARIIHRKQTTKWKTLQHARAANRFGKLKCSTPLFEAPSTPVGSTNTGTANWQRRPSLANSQNLGTIHDSTRKLEKRNSTFINSGINLGVNPGLNSHPSTSSTTKKSTLISPLHKTSSTVGHQFTFSPSAIASSEISAKRNTLKLLRNESVSAALSGGNSILSPGNNQGLSPVTPICQPKPIPNLNSKNNLKNSTSHFPTTSNFTTNTTSLPQNQFNPLSKKQHSQIQIKTPISRQVSHKSINSAQVFDSNNTIPNLSTPVDNSNQISNLNVKKPLHLSKSLHSGIPGNNSFHALASSNLLSNSHLGSSKILSKTPLSRHNSNITPMMHFSSKIGLKKQFKKSKSVADNQPFANVGSGPTGIGLQSSLGQKNLSQAPGQTHVTTKFNQSKNQTTPVRQQKIDLTASFSNASAHFKNKAHHLPKRASIFSSNGNRSLNRQSSIIDPDSRPKNPSMPEYVGRLAKHFFRNAGDKQISQIFDKDELISALTAPEKLQKDEEISHQNKLNKRHSKTQFSRNQSFQDQNRVPLPSLKENVLENVVERVDLVKDDKKDDQKYDQKDDQMDHMLQKEDFGIDHHINLKVPDEINLNEPEKDIILNVPTDGLETVVIPAKIPEKVKKSESEEVFKSEKSITTEENSENDGSDGSESDNSANYKSLTQIELNPHSDDINEVLAFIYVHQEDYNEDYFNFYLQDKEVFLDENDELVFVDQDKIRVYPRMVSMIDDTDEQYIGVEYLKEEDYINDMDEQQLLETNRSTMISHTDFQAIPRQPGGIMAAGWASPKTDIQTEIIEQLNQMPDHRPYFTYWITTVQILICVVMLIQYPIAPFGFSNNHEGNSSDSSNLEKIFSRVYERVSPEMNFWIGPEQKYLVQMGAKYAPCMRKDPKLAACHKPQDNNTILGAECCLAESLLGRDGYPLCAHLPKGSCPSSYTWEPTSCNSANANPENGHSVTQNRPKSSLMTKKCNIVARPCCISVEGRCEVVTEEWCKFKGGTFHRDKERCSDVEGGCLQSSCGMIPFVFGDGSPDQWYRLWLGLFVHYGVLHCAITAIFQLTLLKDLEILCGHWNAGWIYMLSGIMGNLASAMFLPYNVDAGPTAAQFGVISCSFVEILQLWQLFQAPWKVLLRYSLILGLLFLIGLLPFMDNYSNLAGFMSGIFLSFALLPYIYFGPSDLKRKVVTKYVAWGCWFMMLVMLVIGVIKFESHDDYPWLNRINCIANAQVVKSFVSGFFNKEGERNDVCAYSMPKSFNFEHECQMHMN